MNFKNALELEHPLQVVGTSNAYHAILANQIGFNAIYLSGSGVSTASLGLPDLGLISIDDILLDVRRITEVCDLPILVDVDAGGGGALVIHRMTRMMENNGVTAIHIEDQVSSKRCGHRPGKKLVQPSEMCDRVKTCVDARSSDDFFVIARTDALGVEGIDKALERATMYVSAGADAIFAESVSDIADYKKFKDITGVPVLANITEFGKTPLFSLPELREAEVDIVLYPLTAFRAASNAAYKAYEEIRSKGTQKNILNTLQTREDTYRYINYYHYEEKLDQLFGEN